MSEAAVVKSPFELETLDLAYNVQRGVGPELFARIIAEYRRASREVTAAMHGVTGIVYDEPSGEALDVWGAPDGGGGSRPVFVFIHGGYWRALSRHDSAFMAQMLGDRGIATVVPDYTLAPAAALEEIVRQIRACVAWIWQHGAEYGLDPERIVVGGSSAGGHLAAMTTVDGWQAALALPERAVAASMPVSGLFDLRPLVDLYVNAWLGLDADRAALLSPALLQSGSPGRRVVAVAGLDGAGFIDQSRRFASGRPETELLLVPGRNHFDVILDWCDPASALSSALLGLFE